MTNLIIFPPSFILLQIFRKSRRRTTRSVILRKQINKHAKNQKPVENNNQEIDKDKKKQSKPFTLPWWFKIIGYLMAFCIVVVCLFFIIVRGITFGDDLCRKWLTSFIISVLTSIFLTQPIQVGFYDYFIESSLNNLILKRSCCFRSSLFCCFVNRTTKVISSLIHSMTATHSTSSILSNRPKRPTKSNTCEHSLKQRPY